MNKKMLNWICMLAAAAVLAVVGVLGAARANRIRSDTPILIEEAAVDVIAITTVQKTPVPSPTPVLPEFAVTLLVDRRPVLTLNSEPETQRVLWEYLKDSAVSPEGETFVRAKFGKELIIGEPEAGDKVTSNEDAALLLRQTPTLVPVQVEALRVTTAEAEVETTASEDAALAYGTRILTQLGAGSVTESSTEVTYLAGAVEETGEPKTRTLREARATIVRNGTFTRRDTSGEPDKDEGVRGRKADGLKLEWPMRGSVSSYFGFREGRMHNGVDIENKAGTKIVAPGEGVVVYCGERGAYGLVVDIDHGNGFVSRVTHLSDAQVEYNQRVFAGDALGVLADNSTEGKKPHLHYELIIDNVPYNPAFYLS